MHVLPKRDYHCKAIRSIQLLVSKLPQHIECSYITARVNSVYGVQTVTRNLGDMNTPLGLDHANADIVFSDEDIEFIKSSVAKIKLKQILLN